MQNVSLHVGQKQLHVLVLAMSNSFHWQINNVLTKNEIHTLTNAIIADPTQTSLFFWSYAIQGFVAFNAIKGAIVTSTTLINFFF
jgi:hypothetical protein